MGDMGDVTNDTGAAVATVAAPEDDAPDPRNLDAARLREAPTERRVRVVLAVLLLAVSALAAYESVTRPREVSFREHAPYHELAADAAEERLDVVDARAGHKVRWRNRNGAVYEFDRYAADDERARIEAHPYLRSHPGLVRYGSIRVWRLASSPAVTVVLGLAWVLFVVVLVRGPRPRLATRWAWFWASGTGVGQAAYLLLAGSWRRTDPPRPWGHAPPWRLGGAVAFVGLALLRIAWNVGADAYYDGRHPLGSSVELVYPRTTGSG